MRQRLVSLALSALVIVGAVASASGAPDPFEALGAERLLEVKPSAALALPELDGRSVKFPDQFKSKVVLLSFFTTT